MSWHSFDPDMYGPYRCGHCHVSGWCYWVNDIYSSSWYAALEVFDRHLLYWLCCYMICSPVFWSSYSLSYDRSLASSKVNSPQSEISCFLFEFPVSTHILKVIQCFLLPHLSFLQQYILEASCCTRCDQSGYSFLLLHVGCSFPPWLFVILSYDPSSGCSPSFSSTSCALNVAFHLFLP